MKPIEPLVIHEPADDSSPSKSIFVVTRTCMACGETESDSERRPIYYASDKLPRDKRCQRCGTRGLLPGDAETVVMRPIEPIWDWETDTDRPRTGRPPKEVTERRKLATAAAQRVESERKAEMLNNLRDGIIDDSANAALTYGAKDK